MWSQFADEFAVLANFYFTLEGPKVRPLDISQFAEFETEARNIHTFPGRHPQVSFDTERLHDRDAQHENPDAEMCN